MASTTLELLRSTHEACERVETATVEKLLIEPRTHKETLVQSHWVSAMLDEIVREAKILERHYTEGTEEELNRRTETTLLAAGSGPQGQPTPALFSGFYDKLRDIKDYHRRFPNLNVSRPEEEAVIDVASISVPTFTGEELGGRCLDLHPFYLKFFNLPASICPRTNGQPIDYLTYLRKLSVFSDDMDGKYAAYVTYLEELAAYLVSFYRKILPLNDIDEEQQKFDQEFSNKWSSPSGFNWKKIRDEEDTNGSAADQLFCKVCNHHFAKQSVYDAHIPGKKHKAAAANFAKTLEKRRQVVNLEYKVWGLCELLADHLRITRLNVEKKMGRSWEEIQADIEQQEAEDEGLVESEEEEEEEEEDVRVGIKDYPVGWDGKPIPYWLYKLHGLGVEYKCEICGNATYKGRRAYERHFQEWRHTHGMKCLGIPNTKHFQDVTRIQDAIALYKKLQKDLKNEEWIAGDDEEFEDTEGNVVKKKVFDDLKRQGLI